MNQHKAIWDLFMDFSLLQAGARHVGLRDILALKKRWPYYSIIVLDPIIRFAWIFYAIFTHDRQHSTLCSFFVAFAEVLRRGMWTCFRVENEHCGNVSQYKASRDVPLPYTMEPLMDRPSTDVEGDGDGLHPLPPSQQQQPTPAVAAPEAGQVTGSSTAVTSTIGGALRRRDTTAYSVSKLLAEAHKQDFEKKRKSPEQVAQEAVDRHNGPSDDDDDDDDEDSVFDVSEAESRRRTGDVTPESQV